MSFTIRRTNSPGRFEIPVKRFYLPYIVEGDCPGCGKRMTVDLDSEYLSFPYAWDEKETIPLYHVCDEDKGVTWEGLLRCYITVDVSVHPEADDY